MVAIRAWRTSQHSGAMVLLQSDSLSALSAISKQSSSSDAIRRILCELALDDADMDSGLSKLMHIPGLSNKWPDAVSRLWEHINAKKFPYELAKVERTHVPIRTVDAFWSSLRAVASALPVATLNNNRRVVIQFQDQ